MQKDAKDLDWLGTGMRVQGLCPNKMCKGVNASTYRPWISHVFTFRSQKAKLNQVAGDLLNAIKQEKTKKVTPKSFQPKVKKSIVKTRRST